MLDHGAVFVLAVGGKAFGLARKDSESGLRGQADILPGIVGLKERMILGDMMSTSFGSYVDSTKSETSMA